MIIMKKKFLLVLFFLSVISSAQAEQRSLSSYHPSPFGFYDQLKFIPQDTVANPIACSPANRGLIFYDQDEGKLMICGGSGNRLVAAWEQTGLSIYPADSADDIFVGIGDQSPDALLEISSSGLAHHYLMLSSDDNNDGDVFIVRNNGRVGISSTLPQFRLTIDHNKVGLGNADGGILSYGNLGTGASYGLSLDLLTNPTFFWYPRTASFSARRMGPNLSNLAFNQFSYTFGYDTLANAYGAFASGFSSTANFINSFASGMTCTAGNNYSFASGNSTIAGGEYSVATGQGSQALGYASVAMGTAAVASGDSSVSLGNATVASGNYSISIGDGMYSTAIASVAVGLGDTGAGLGIASGDYSVAMGYEVNASEEASMAFGRSGSSGKASFASGKFSNAMGDYSVGIGVDVKSSSYAQTSLGMYNVFNVADSANSWIDTEPLFVIGNGNSATRSNALTILKNGNIGIGTSTPGASRLRIVGGDASVDAAHSWIDLSDVRLKKNIENLGTCLDQINHLQGIKYHSLQEDISDPLHIGLIAQDVEKYFPSLVSTDTSTENQYKSLAYGKITPVLLEGVKELKSKSDEIEMKMNVLEEKLKYYKNLLSQTEK